MLDFSSPPQNLHIGPKEFLITSNTPPPFLLSIDRVLQVRQTRLLWLHMEVLADILKIELVLGLKAYQQAGSERSRRALDLKASGALPLTALQGALFRT